MSQPTARDDVLQALGDLGGSATPAELRQATGRPARTISDALGRLRADGLVRGSQNRPEMTAAGRSAAGATIRPPEGRFEEAVAAVFGPSPALSAFCRLAADLIVARHLYGELDFHPALFAYGASGRGKTAAAELLVRSLGVGREAILSVPALAAGELVGRRSPVAGGGYRFEPARHLGLPFFCLDELGEADSETRKAAQVLCHGELFVRVEGEEVRIAGTPMATWNPRAGVTVVAAPYLRRALVLCVDEIVIPDLRGRLRLADLNATGARTLPLGNYRRPVDRLEDSAVRVLGGTFTQMSDEGATRTDMRMLELAALGRAARYDLIGDADRRGVAYFVAFDVLTVAETVPGLTRDDWRIDVEAVLSGLGDVPGLADLASAATVHRSARDELRQRIVARRRNETRVGIELVGERAHLVATLEQAIALIKLVPPPERAGASAVRAMLRKVRDEAGNARSAESLGEIATAAQPLLEQARALRQRLDEDANRLRVEREREQRDARAMKREQGERAKAYRQAAALAKRQRRDELAALHKRRRELRRLLARRRTTHGESPAAMLIAAGVVRWIEVTKDVEIRPSVLDRVSAHFNGDPKPASRPGVRTTLFLEDRCGERWRPDQLASWGSPCVLSALEAALADTEALLAPLEREIGG